MTLASKHCQGKPALLTTDKIKQYISQLNPDWQLAADSKQISRDLKFKNYYETMAFVNMVAMIAHQQDHHPDLEVHYNKCTVVYSTHGVGGLSEFDFICAAKIDASLPI